MANANYTDCKRLLAECLDRIQVAKAEIRQKASEMPIGEESHTCQRAYGRMLKSVSELEKAFWEFVEHDDAVGK